MSLVKFSQPEITFSLGDCHTIITNHKPKGWAQTK